MASALSLCYQHRNPIRYSLVIRSAKCLISNTMNLTTLTAADLKKITGLMKEKESLLSQIARINAGLAAFDDAEPVKAPKGKSTRKAGAKVKRAARGSVKAATIELLKQAGTAGITVSEIAAKLGARYGQVFNWFQATGKGIKEIKKLGPGKFGWVGTTPVKPAAVVPVEPKPVVPGKAPVVAKPAKAPKAARPEVKKKPAQAEQPPSQKPAVAKDAVIELVKQSGKAGVTVKEIAAKLQVDSQRIYVWFNSTGKSVKAIKKVAPAKYAWVG